jgi:hypothetical protein
MAVIDVPRNWRDHSTTEGFQFSFYCDVCRREYKSTFIRSKTDRMGDVVKTFGSFLGGRTGSTMRSAGSKAHRSAGHSKEKDEAFAKAWNEIKQYFRKCPRDHAWVCFDCFNADTNLCVKCSPRVGVEMAAAQSQVAVQQMHKQVRQTQQFHGDASTKTVGVCPSCGHAVTGGGKFCNNCGAMLSQPGCPTCGAQNAPNAKFCNSCGQKLM